MLSICRAFQMSLPPSSLSISEGLRQEADIASAILRRKGFGTRNGTQPSEGPEDVFWVGSTGAATSATIIKEQAATGVTVESKKTCTTMVTSQASASWDLEVITYRRAEDGHRSIAAEALHLLDLDIPQKNSSTEQENGLPFLQPSKSCVSIPT